MTSNICNKKYEVRNDVKKKKKKCDESWSYSFVGGVLLLSFTIFLNYLCEAMHVPNPLSAREIFFIICVWLLSSALHWLIVTFQKVTLTKRTNERASKRAGGTETEKKKEYTKEIQVKNYSFVTRGKVKFLVYFLGRSFSRTRTHTFILWCVFAFGGAKPK